MLAWIQVWGLQTHATLCMETDVHNHFTWHRHSAAVFMQSQQDCEHWCKDILLQAGARGQAQWGLWIWGAHPWRCPLYLMTQLMLVLVTHKVGSIANPKACTLHSFLQGNTDSCVPQFLLLELFSCRNVFVYCNIIGGCHIVFRLSTCSVATSPLSTHCLLTVYPLSTHCLLTIYSLSTHCLLTVYPLFTPCPFSLSLLPITLITVRA